MRIGRSPPPPCCCSAGGRPAGIPATPPHTPPRCHKTTGLVRGPRPTTCLHRSHESPGQMQPPHDRDLAPNTAHDQHRQRCPTRTMGGSSDGEEADQGEVGWWWDQGLTAAALGSARGMRELRTGLNPRLKTNI
jgi:hypothetical protein